MHTTLSTILPEVLTSVVNFSNKSAVVYSNVTDFDIDPITLKKNGKKEFIYNQKNTNETVPLVPKNPTFYNNPLYTSYDWSDLNNLTKIVNYNYVNNFFSIGGEIQSTKTYKRDVSTDELKLISSTDYTYSVLKYYTRPENYVFNINKSPFSPYPPLAGYLLSSYYTATTNPAYNKNSDSNSMQFIYYGGKSVLSKTVLKTVTNKEYDIAENVTSNAVTNYFYDNLQHCYLTRTETLNSKNELIKSKLYYPADLLSAGIQQPIEMQKLIDKNIIDEPIKTETYLNTVKTSESNTKYEESTSTGMVLQPKEIHVTKGITNTYPFSDQNKKITYTLYDSDLTNGKGNVLEIKKPNGVYSSTIWGYNKAQPIAQIENITYNSIPSSLITNAQTASNTGTESDLLSALTALRNDPALSSAMITTYTYKPLVGISTITDPNGITIYNEYDSANRLVYVKDNNKNIIKSFCYNFQGQIADCGITISPYTYTYMNKEKKVTFIKNNCASGSIGTSVTYTVPLGKYTSNISQAAADAQAQNEIDLNGQNNANSLGTCTFSNTQLTVYFYKNNCTTGKYGSRVAYTVAAGKYTSTNSQANADSQAQAEANTNGQANANSVGTCDTYRSVAKSGTFTRNNCPDGSGTSVIYTVPAGKYTSNVSQANADSQAQGDVATNGQAYANINGICTE
ncbi:hypothetical protein BD847_0018 [Flavobacterium cutihirudinis]|uniref:DUF5977 domain-containing protein n=1 Tax=Flavobacterium cutihirudinis TaxID=1265740 RepID=A0A3D9G0N4_9FLAO|nr:DUF5977 domain-containing protein [Flavobacterium cutihirudinis]RED26112.1 hypothetical protein BD847_0018 [Flavobacterium cutihirudinis]